MREALSNNHFSHDQQLQDVLNKLTPREWEMVISEFPELDSDIGIIYEGFVGASHWDTVKMGVDIEYPQHVTDFIEAHTDIHWEDGEPWREVDTSEVEVEE
jgi:hypothetical protein